MATAASLAILGFTSPDVSGVCPLSRNSDSDSEFPFLLRFLDFTGCTALQFKTVVEVWYTVQR